MTKQKNPSLREILKNKENEIMRSKEQSPLAVLKKRIERADFAGVDFGGSIYLPGHISIIAEIKYKSPSAGTIRETGKEDVFERIRCYRSGGASAISFLTDKKYFGGDIKLLKAVKENTTLPVLRKDFIIDEYQVYESKAYGADALLLIASILSSRELKKFYRLACGLGMDCLIEVHAIEDLKKLPSDARIVGINNRDLSHPEYKTNISTTLALAPMIGGDKILVSESGISVSNIYELRKVKVNAVLIGTELMKTSPQGSKNLIKKLIKAF
ncbi:MAG: indole-3-glycerol phosphate synthase TrpC [bacterium]